jgi:hypothetical protein
MARKKHAIQLPPGINPGGLITVRKAAEITGIPMKTLYEWRRQPGLGLRVYKLRRKIFFKVDELLRWIDANIRQ